MTTIAELINRWNSDEGKPYKGSLIDFHAYKDDPSIGCMCAQGQVLHLVAGWTPEQLNVADQHRADAETAKILNISCTHAVLLRSVNDSADGAPAVVLTDPGKVLGDKWSALLDFWCYLDSMTAEQWDAARDAAWAAAGEAAGEAAGDFSRAAAWIAAQDAARDAACAAAGDASWEASWAASLASAEDAEGVAARASNEIQGEDILRKNGTPLFFLPAFGFDSLADIPPRPENYGILK